MKLSLLLITLLSCIVSSSSFSLNSPSSALVARSRRSSRTVFHMSTTVAPPREKTDTDRSIRRKNDEDDRSTNPEDIAKYNDAPMEYLEDENATRNPEDPFHILLLDTTFEKSDRVTISYVSGSLQYVLGMPEEEATELTTMCADNGMSCLGTWERQECLKLGKQLQMRDCVVRVVPFCAGGSRGWQAKSGAGDSGAIDVPFSSGWE